MFGLEIGQVMIIFLIMCWMIAVILGIIFVITRVIKLAWKDEVVESNYDEEYENLEDLITERLIYEMDKKDTPTISKKYYFD